MKFNIILNKDKDGGYSVTVPALDGCFTQGDTIDEAVGNAKEAIICYLEGLQKVNEIKLGPNAIIKELEIAI